MSKNFKSKTISIQSLSSSSQLKRSEMKTKNLIERAKEELEKERERKRMRTLYKSSIKTKESTSNTICSMSTNGSDISYISYISTNSFQEQQQYFTNNIIDYSKSSRENLYLITKQLSEIINKNNKKKSNNTRYKKQMNIQI